MAGMSNSEYARHKEEKATLGTLIWSLTKLGFFVLLFVLAPAIIVTFWIGIFVVVMLWTAIGDAFRVPDRY